MSQATPRAELVLYATEDGSAQFFLRAEGGSVWLSQSELAELFQTSTPNINIHIKNVLDEGELTEIGTIKNDLIVQTEGDLPGLCGITRHATQEPAYGGLAGLRRQLHELQ